MRISDWSSDVCSSDLGQHFGLAPQTRFVGSRQWQYRRTEPGRLPRRRGLLYGGLGGFENNMGIGAAEAETADPGPPHRAFGPGPRAIDDLNRETVPCDARVGRRLMQ